MTVYLYEHWCNILVVALVLAQLPWENKKKPPSKIENPICRFLQVTLKTIEVLHVHTYTTYLSPCKKGS